MDRHYIIIEKKVNQLQKKQPTGEILLHTDKIRYQPGEDIWIKGYVHSQVPDQPSIEKEVYLRLADEKEYDIYYLRYPLQDNTFNACLNIPGNIRQGKYSLVSYTAQQTGDAKGKAFIQHVFISDEWHSVFINR